MLVPSLLSLAISIFAALLSVSTNEEIVQVIARGIALVGLLASLVLAPWLVLLILAVPLMGLKLAQNPQ
ncbi:hypothetical protein PCC9214_04090 [Planktothrix tepida]|uniref:Uncharacterized protein n=3 Tax=Planktothrix TaxID=54304 RepID=A0A1J1LQ08_9CYAN|nr:MULTISPECIES: hypothetical protein [Planktothrix]MBD2485070.1 hypothetical protein [Planktothrix sp. FACHB-1365]MBE9144525.1 hypothetical protein [Planktothrix mougeotii LEGE 06226]CAD5935088.1 hypothetical protein NO713_01542 [Planktothrix pseudagardhii]CAD5974936.1 hypothetical protein PCC9214_04090 [Planktothrix tepida]CUR34318.1 conserved exported hypothetical protein [Planktothrix tepida PCC 9214]